jgi:lipopolysaccharide export system ATP-binding protein
MSGKILFLGEDVTKRSVSQRAAMGLIYLPQQHSLIPEISVHENLMLVYEASFHWKKEKREKFKQEMSDWFARLSVPDRILKSAAKHLSGGEKRKIEIIRSILFKPELLLLDEPFAGIDPKSVDELKSVFIELRKMGISLLISDHNVLQLSDIADDAYLLYDGKIAVHGTPKELLSDRHAKKLYFGKLENFL